LRGRAIIIVIYMKCGGDTVETTFHSNTEEVESVYAVP
jgi:hypothetical protein